MPVSRNLRPVIHMHGPEQGLCASGRPASGGNTLLILFDLLACLAATFGHVWRQQGAIGEALGCSGAQIVVKARPAVLGRTLKAPAPGERPHAVRCAGPTAASWLLQGVF
jgi:hypothetical protein